MPIIYQKVIKKATTYFCEKERGMEREDVFGKSSYIEVVD